MKKTGVAVIIVLLIPSLLLAKRKHPERWYQERWCEAHRGQIEVVLPDGTRCDCLTDTQMRLNLISAANGPRLSDKVRITHYKPAKKKGLF